MAASRFSSLELDEDLLVAIPQDRRPAIVQELGTRATHSPAPSEVSLSLALDMNAAQDGMPRALDADRFANPDGVHQQAQQPIQQAAPPPAQPIVQQQQQQQPQQPPPPVAVSRVSVSGASASSVASDHPDAALLDRKPASSANQAVPQPPAEPFPGLEAQRASIERAKELYQKRLERLMIDEAAMFNVDRWGNVREAAAPGDAKAQEELAARKRLAAKRELEAEKLWRQKVNIWRQLKPAEIKKLVRAGIPDSFRAMTWGRLTGALHKMDANPGVYQKYVEQTRECEHAATIFRDLDRTWPRHVFFRDPRGDNKESEGRDRLGNVLRAYSVFNPQIGYTQGMGFVVGIFLMYFKEEEAFWMLHALLTDPKYELGGLYEPGFPLLFRHCHQFDGLLRSRLPKVRRALLASGCIPQVYATQWFMTLFTYNFPFDVVLRFMDVLLSEGHKIIFRVAMFHMQRSQKQLLAAAKANPDPAEAMIPMLTVLKNINRDPLLDDVDDYIKAVLKIRVTHAELDKLARSQDQ